MGAEQSSLSGSINDDDKESQIYVTDIVIECTQHEEDHTPVPLTELCMFGLGCEEEDGKCFPLSATDANGWKMMGSVPLAPGVEGIDCIVKSQDHGDFRFVHLECVRGKEGKSISKRFSRVIEDDEGQSQYVISWELVEIPPEASIGKSFPLSTMSAFNNDTRRIGLSWEELYQTSVDFNNKYESTRELSDINGAISAAQKATGIVPVGSREHWKALNVLGASLFARSKHRRSLEDLERAISAVEESARLTPASDPDNPMVWNNLALMNMFRFEHTRTLTHLAAAISAQSRVVSLTPQDHEHLCVDLNNLGTLLLSRFQHTGDAADLVQATSLHSKALDMAPEGHSAIPFSLQGIGLAFENRYRLTSDPADLAKAASFQTRSLNQLPKGHRARPCWLSNLGGLFTDRLERNRDHADLAEAVAYSTRAVNLAPDDDENLPIYLATLGRVLLIDRDTAALGVSMMRRAVDLMPEGHPLLSSRLHDLGTAIVCLYRLTGDPTHLAEGTSLLHRAMDMVPEGHPDVFTHLRGLGELYKASFGHTDDPHDLEEAVSMYRRALELTPEGHDTLVWQNTFIGDTYYKLFALSGLAEHLDASITHFRSATRTAGSPHKRVDAAKGWASILNRHRPHSAEVLTAFEVAICTLAVTAGLEQTIQHRYSHLRRYSSLPLLAAKAAFRLDRPDKALEWLEQGRCLVWTQQSQLRTPLVELQAADSTLAERVLDVSKRLEGAGASRRHLDTHMTMGEKISLEDEAQNHLHLAREWDEILTKARALPGFENFLTPASCAFLLESLPAQGPIIVVNVHEDGCDAAALLAGLRHPFHIPLPGFTLEKAKKYRNDLNTHLHRQGLRRRGTKDSEAPAKEEEGGGLRRGRADDVSTRAAGVYRRKEGGVRGVLLGLWTELVKPILSALAITKADDSSTKALPRIWWCPTGPLSFLPIHAAGDYRGMGSDCLMDYAVSSYTPTVASLTQRVRLDHPIDQATSGLFLTSQPKAPGACSIPGTTGEVTSIYSKATEQSVRTMLSEGDSVSPDECLKYMEDFSSIHLACHATQDASEPLRSKFIFHKGKLELQAIMQRNLKNADLAFLSACETSTGEETLPDEAVHLAAGMLAAGYRRVVATMWSIGDKHASAVASDFYQYLWENRDEGSGGQFDGTLSACALHHAIRQLRDRLDNSDRSLLAWIPYVHFGY